MSSTQTNAKPMSTKPNSHRKVKLAAPPQPQAQQAQQVPPQVQQVPPQAQQVQQSTQPPAQQVPPQAQPQQSQRPDHAQIEINRAMTFVSVVRRNMNAVARDLDNPHEINTITFSTITNITHDQNAKSQVYTNPFIHKVISVTPEQTAEICRILNIPPNVFERQPPKSAGNNGVNTTGTQNEDEYYEY